MLSEFIDKIVSLSTPVRVTLEDDGKKRYYNRRFYPIGNETPEPLVLGTLTGIVDYLGANKDGLDFKDLMIHVKSYDRVFIKSKIINGFQQRHTYAVAEFNISEFPFGDWMQSEDFIIKLQTLFRPTADLEALLKLVGNIRDEQVKTVTDDGVSQQVTAAVGLAKVKDVRVPNPVILKPVRTFPEIAQPAAPFVCRLKRGTQETPLCSLHECDGGQWELDAIESIATWLKKKIGSVSASVIR